MTYQIKCGGCGLNCAGTCGYAPECAPLIAVANAAKVMGGLQGFPPITAEDMRCRIGSATIASLTGENCAVIEPGDCDPLETAMQAGMATVFAGIALRHCLPLRTEDGAALFADPFVAGDLAPGSYPWIAYTMMLDMVALATRHALISRTDFILQDDPPIFVDQYSKMVKGFHKLTLPGVAICDKGAEAKGGFGIGVSQRARFAPVSEGCCTPAWRATLCS